MPRYDGGWPAYVPVAERRRKAAREVARLQKGGKAVAPVQIAGRAIATTVWGKAWCDNLEAYRDYESRLPRGRTYVRNGSVIDLQIAPRKVEALVSGSEIYRVRVSIEAIGKAAWRSICADCTGRIESLVELLQGRLSKGVMQRLCRQAQGLFPKPAEVQFSCSCPDFAWMCKHVAAVLYGIGARLDDKPDLLFRLRGVDPNELVADLATAIPTSAGTPASSRILEHSDVSALFGVDIAALAPDDMPEPPPEARRAPRQGRSGPPRLTSRTRAPEAKPSGRKRTREGIAPDAAERPSKAVSKGRVRQASAPRATPPRTGMAKVARGLLKHGAAGTQPKGRQASAETVKRKDAAVPHADDKPVKWWLSSKSSNFRRTHSSSKKKSR